MKIVVEVVGPQNEMVLFPPNEQKMRGRWDFANVADKDYGRSQGLKTMARQIRSIPGLCIAVDTEKSEGIIYDPLEETPEGKSLWVKIDEIVKANQVEFGERFKPHPTTKTSLDVNGIKNWCWWIARLVQMGVAQKVTGSDSIPTCDEVSAMPGHRIRDPLNTGPQTGKGIPGEEALPKYVDIVPIPSVSGKGK